MKHFSTAITLSALTVWTTLAHSQTISSQSDAFNAGKAFAQPGMNSAAGTVNSTTGNQNLPNFTTTAPESANFGNGKGAVGAAGTSKQLQCQNGAKSTDAFTQQECDAVNFLAKNPSVRPKFIIDKKTDPILTGSSSTIKNPGGIPGSSNQQCHVVNVITPGTFSTENCEQSIVTDNVTCNKNLIPECAFTGSDITSSSTSKSGAFLTSSLSPTGTPGLYNYRLEVPYRNCGGDGSAEIDFNLDTVGQGGYITINMSNLDDAAAVGVNGYTVFAGYPNGGPVYSGDYFPQTAKAFQIGYTWTEKSQGRCVEGGPDSNCNVMRPAYQTFTANTKLLDFCPGGLQPTVQSQFESCDNDGNCKPISSYTPDNVMGFFCNSEGKYLMNRHEGKGTWDGSVSAQMPLQKGGNSVQIYWGTGPWGGACGNVTITGQIYNVAPSCSAPWNDGCASMRAAQ
jgi:hypothetical protein